MPDIITFADAIADSEQYKKRHLILGNGFSINCRANIFHYASLFGEADFSLVPEAKAVFEALGTHDFEITIRALESSSTLVQIYTPRNLASAQTMRDHAAALKEILVSAIANRHPETPNTITDEEFRACRKFLNHFLGPGQEGYVFTLNYDLLLYWALMHEDHSFGDEPLDLEKNDSFGNDEDDPDADYVVGKVKRPHTPLVSTFYMVAFTCSIPDPKFKNTRGYERESRLWNRRVRPSMRISFRYLLRRGKAPRKRTKSGTTHTCTSHLKS